MTNLDSVPEQAPPRGRLLVGGIILIGGQLCPLLIAVVASSNLPLAWKSALSGILLLGVPELCVVISVAILGKPGFVYLKHRVFAVFRQLAPPETVSIARYRVGLVLFVVPLFGGWLLGYFSNLIPDYETHRISINLALDLTFLTSLFILGGDFWDKLKALFNHEARVQLANHQPSIPLCDTSSTSTHG